MTYLEACEAIDAWRSGGRVRSAAARGGARGFKLSAVVGSLIVATGEGEDLEAATIALASALGVAPRQPDA